MVKDSNISPKYIKNIPWFHSVATTKTSLKTRPEHKCEPLRIQTCKRFYNHTRMPNFLNQKSQRSVKTSLQRSRRYLKKEKSTCREPLRLFLCSLYVPKCSGSLVPELPCRSLCRKVKKALRANCGARQHNP